MSDYLAGLMACPDDGEPRHPDLTQRQHSILRFLRDYFARTGHSPSMKEIGAAIGLQGSSGVSYQLDVLQRKGYLSRDPGRPRTIKLRGTAGVGLPPLALGPAARAGSLVPVVGRVRAGGPLSAINLGGQTDEYVALPPHLASGPQEHFALEVVGDSMIDRAIEDGDRVVIRAGGEARNNDIVVAQFRPDPFSGDDDEDKVTIKTYKRLGGRVWLMPGNSAYDPIPGDNAKILGRVVYLTRTPR